MTIQFTIRSTNTVLQWRVYMSVIVFSVCLWSIVDDVMSARRPNRPSWPWQSRRKYAVYWKWPSDSPEATRNRRRHVMSIYCLRNCLAPSLAINREISRCFSFIDCFRRFLISQRIFRHGAILYIHVNYRRVGLSPRNFLKMDIHMGEVTSRSLWSRYDRHFVGITRYNAFS